MIYMKLRIAKLIYGYRYQKVFAYGDDWIDHKGPQENFLRGYN